MKAKKFVSFVSNSTDFEYALEGRSFVKLTGKSRSFAYSNDRVLPMIDDGYLELDRIENGRYYYRPTPAGLAWWYSERLRDFTERYELKSLEPGAAAARSWLDPASLALEFEGKGIGAEVQIHIGGQRVAVFVALQRGFLEFVLYSDYNPIVRHGPSELINVKLTREGMAFFDSLPRLELECA